VARDGALFVSEDGNGTVCRIAFGGDEGVGRRVDAASRRP
jgi:hypothetical protein